MAIPVLLYGSETWTLTATQKKRIEAAEMRFLRPYLWVLNVKSQRGDTTRNKDNVAN